MPFLDTEAAQTTPHSTQPAIDRFNELVQDLSDALGPCSGLDSEDVDPLDIRRLMEGYASDTDGWERYALEDSSRAYTRNLVDEGNGKSNLLVLVWSPGKGSPVHDHANAHCVMKVLKGSLKETLYAWPDSEKVAQGQSTPMKATKETVYDEDQVTYMSDQLGLHKISNPDSKDFAISLHLYTPPNAAQYGCNVFDERTGKSHHVQQCNFFSWMGRKL